MEVSVSLKNMLVVSTALAGIVVIVIYSVFCQTRKYLIYPILATQASSCRPKQPRSSVDIEINEAAKVLLGEDTHVLELLGWGSFGRVYRVIWSGREMALKINVQNVPEGMALGSTEGFLGKTLRHPNLVESYLCCQRQQTTETVGSGLDSASYTESDFGESDTATMTGRDFSEEVGGVITNDGFFQTKNDQSKFEPVPDLLELTSSTVPHDTRLTNITFSATDRGTESCDWPTHNIVLPNTSIIPRPQRLQTVQEGSNMSDACSETLPGGESTFAEDAMSPYCRQRQSIDLSEYDVDSGPDSDDEDTPAAPETGQKRIIRIVETWIVMEFMDLGSLRSALNSKLFRHNVHSPKLGVICKTAIEVARGLQSLHSNNVIHGDLTTKNIMLRTHLGKKRGFTAKIGDFGLSRAFSDQFQTHQTTNTFGCVTHMAPELLLSGKLSTKTDVFSFGIILWEMYTSKCPYSGLRPGEIIHHVVHQKQRPVFPYKTLAIYKNLAQLCWSEDHRLRPNWKEVVESLKTVMRLS